MSDVREMTGIASRLTGIIWRSPSTSMEPPSCAEEVVCRFLVVKPHHGVSTNQHRCQ